MSMLILMLLWIANSLVLRADTEADALFMPVGHKDSGGDPGFNSNALMRARGSLNATPRSFRFKDRAQRPGIVPRPSSAVHHGEPHDGEQMHSFVTHDDDLSYRASSRKTLVDSGRTKRKTVAAVPFRKRMPVIFEIASYYIAPLYQNGAKIWM